MITLNTINMFLTKNITSDSGCTLGMAVSHSLTGGESLLTVSLRLHLWLYYVLDHVQKCTPDWILDGRTTGYILELTQLLFSYLPTVLTKECSTPIPDYFGVAYSDSLLHAHNSSYRFTVRLRYYTNDSINIEIHFLKRLPFRSVDTCFFVFSILNLRFLQILILSW